MRAGGVQEAGLDVLENINMFRDNSGGEFWCYNKKHYGHIFSFVKMTFCMQKQVFCSRAPADLFLSKETSTLDKHQT